MSDIDWTSELRKVEREFSGLPPEPSPVVARAKRVAGQREQERKTTRAAAFSAWTRVMLILALAGSLSLWPYPHACGMGLLGYLGAETLIVLGAGWLGVLTWQYRLARTHIVALAMALGGLALIAVQVLPRVGYAKNDPTRPARWSCTATAGR